MHLEEDLKSTSRVAPPATPKSAWAAELVPARSMAHGRVVSSPRTSESSSHVVTSQEPSDESLRGSQTPRKKRIPGPLACLPTANC